MTYTPEELEAFKERIDQHLDTVFAPIVDYNNALKAREIPWEDSLVYTLCNVTSVAQVPQEVVEKNRPWLGYKKGLPQFELGVKSEVGKLERVLFTMNNGNPIPIQPGDKINAFFFMGKYIEERGADWDIEYPKHIFGRRLIKEPRYGRPAHLVEREFESTETAFKIQVLNQGNILRDYILREHIDYSRRYDNV